MRHTIGLEREKGEKGRKRMIEREVGGEEVRKKEKRKREKENKKMRKEVIV